MGGGSTRGHGARILGTISGLGFQDEILMRFVHQIIIIIIITEAQMGTMNKVCRDLGGALG